MLRCTPSHDPSWDWNWQPSTTGRVHKLAFCTFIVISSHPSGIPVILCVDHAVDGGWSRWSPWSRCDKRCGGGRSIRTRSCSSPPPKNGGKKCQGEKNQVKPCNTKPCGEAASHLHPQIGGLQRWPQRPESVWCVLHPVRRDWMPPRPGVCAVCHALSTEVCRPPAGHRVP